MELSDCNERERKIERLIIELPKGRIIKRGDDLRGKVSGKYIYIYNEWDRLAWCPSLLPHYTVFLLPHHTIYPTRFYSGTHPTRHPVSEWVPRGGSAERGANLTGKALRGRDLQ